jgi:hypothetical protein
MKQFYFYCCLIAVLMMDISVKAQDKLKAENPMKKGLTFYFGADSSARFRFIGLGQVVARYLELNEGSKAPDGKIKSSAADIALTRICLGGIFSYKRFQFYYLFGNSGMTIYSGKLGNFYTYESWMSYQLIDKKLALGIGQSLYSGPSRYSSISSVSSISPELSWLPTPTLANGDLIARQFHVFGNGHLGNLEYRVALVRPFTNSVNPSTNINSPYFPDLSAKAPIETSYDIASDKFGTEGYFNYQFFDKEDIRTAARSFSYLNAKKIFTIGAGYEYQPRATAKLNQNRDTLYHHALTLCIDSYLDLPLANDANITGYLAFFRYDYGNNWLRKMGSMNYFTGGTTKQGAGISEYTVGTGNGCYFHLGYMFAKRFTAEKHKLQVYVSYVYKDYEALKDVSHQPGVGLNYFILDHNAKVSVQYLRRPCYDNAMELKNYKNNVLIQIQAAF